MASPFRIVEHVVPGQYLREYPRATSTSQEETLYLAVKQYIPLNNPEPQPGDVTFIAAHANGFPKVRASEDRCCSAIFILTMTSIGALRAIVGGYICPITRTWLQDTQHLDG